ncbi:MAG: MFS transporter [Promethearchaeia archaeon]
MTTNFNKLSFMIVYFSTTAVLVYLNTYLPVFFFNVLNVDRVKLSFIQLFSYAGLLLKPIFGFISDKYSIRNYKRKPYLIVSALILFLSFMGITFNLSELYIFGIFLCVNFIASSMLEVATKGLLVDVSFSREEKTKNTFFTKIGAALGSMFPNVVFLFYFQNIYSVGAWTLFLSFSFLFLIPLVIFALFSSENERSSRAFSKENHSSQSGSTPPKFKLSYISICLFIFLLYGDKLFEFPLEPWIVDKFGENQFYLFSLLMIIGIFVNMVGFFIGTYILKNINRKNIIAFCTALCGVFEILFGFVSFFALLVLFAIVQILAGIISVNLSSLILEFAKDKNVFYIQIIILFFSLSIIIFVPLGTFLSSFLATEIIFILSGTILVISLLPLSMVRIS